jgi:hypothetical protein
MFIQYNHIKRSKAIVYGKGVFQDGEIAVDSMASAGLGFDDGGGKAGPSADD